MGEVHDSLRDFIPAMTRRLVGRGRRGTALRPNEFWALRDVSFRVIQGEVLGIVGHNGAGKSTVLKILTKILEPTFGDCRVQGRIGALIEIAAGFHPDLSGRENVYLQGAIMGMRRHEIAAKFEEIVEFSGIGAFIDTPVKRYSSGMNARLGFAVAAHLDPEVMVIDEVLAVGDVGFQQRCYERLASFRTQGIPIVFVSHNMHAVATLCNRAMLLRRGEAPIFDSVPRVIEQYVMGHNKASDDRVADYQATLRERGKARVVDDAIEPGTPLDLDVSIQVKVPLPRCGVGLQVQRADGHVVFEGLATGPDAFSVDVPAGGTVRGRFQLSANLLRGTFFVSLLLVDRDARWESIFVLNCVSIMIHESFSASGTTDLGLRWSPLSAV